MTSLYGVLVHLLCVSVLQPSVSAHPGLGSNVAQKAAHRPINVSGYYDWTPVRLNYENARILKANFQKLLKLHDDAMAILEYLFLNGVSTFVVASVRVDIQDISTTMNQMTSRVASLGAFDKYVDKQTKTYHEKMLCSVGHAFVAVSDNFDADFKRFRACLSFFLSPDSDVLEKTTSNDETELVKVAQSVRSSISIQILILKSD